MFLILWYRMQTIALISLSCRYKRHKNQFTYHFHPTKKFPKRNKIMKKLYLSNSIRAWFMHLSIPFIITKVKLVRSSVHSWHPVSNIFLPNVDWSNQAQPNTGRDIKSFQPINFPQKLHVRSHFTALKYAFTFILG